MEEKNNVLTFEYSLNFESTQSKYFIEIDKESLNEIFQPYYTTKKEGTGLGLTLVKKIVDDHAGEIKIQSKEGEGTNICILFPLNE